MGIWEAKLNSKSQFWNIGRETKFFETESEKIKNLKPETTLKQKESKQIQSKNFLKDRNIWIKKWTRFGG
jgi:hypothetical protein